MKIALLGFGKEGQATKEYFESHFPDATFDIFENETTAEIRARDYSCYDIIFRSPSIPPLGRQNESSVTRYFFDRCPCKIIGVTATKGKGTTCSLIKALLDAEGADAYLVGNIGEPAINTLDRLKENSVVVYELSSFQLWDLEKSPHIACLGQLEPDHLNIHKSYADYLAAKSHITSHQLADDYLVYFKNNPETTKLAKHSPAGRKVPYPFDIPADIEGAVTLPGKHNIQNAMSAIAAVACHHNISPNEYLQQSADTIKRGLSEFHGLPHRLEFIRELHGVRYYDDNFSTNPSSTRVAVNAFPDSDLTVIIGGRDKTDNEDIPEIYEILQAPQVKHIILLGESGHELATRYPEDVRFILVDSLKTAVTTARRLAEELVVSTTYHPTEPVIASAASAATTKSPIVLMSPAAASFDMFKNVYDRGDQFKSLICSLAH